MQLREYFNHFIKELKPIYGPDESHAITEMIFEHFAGADKKHVISQPHRILETPIMRQLSAALLHLKNRVPVQQVIGHCHFAGLRFKVTPAVLIPRPETEELVHKACDFISKNNKITVLDIGTGSGCIGISIQHFLKHTKVSCIDVSEEALKIARENALLNKSTANIFLFDFLDEDKWDQLGSFDIIISNPPYIPYADKSGMDKNVVDHEPHIALFVTDEDPLVFYHKIAAFATKHLAANGAIFLETHESYAKEVAGCFAQAGFEAEVLKDFFEKERMVKVIRSH